MGTTTIAAITSPFRHRAKLVVAGLASAMLTGFLVFVLLSQQPWSSALAAEEINSNGDYDQIVVQPGDTLWGISARLSGDREQRVIFDQILAYNDLASSDLEVGQTLYIPITE
ncbi:MAG TPA: LysM peptidoglycan-binding domain-containing protein [Candidatus Yaniella excrementigallinarum]|nr:LysM peptidoglycan-binding domain-containing protein [Candidatus Yaniella excrementigallinarum]